MIEVTIHRECTENTPLKHSHYREIIKFHLSICSVLKRKRPWTQYLYVDLNSGPGYYEKINEPCSPIIFLSESNQHQILEPQSHFVEINPAVFKELQNTLFDLRNSHTNTNFQLYHMDNLMFSELFCRKYSRRPFMGLVFADPMGAGKSEFESLQQFSQTFPYVDLLIHLQGASIKRASHCPITSEHGNLSLPDYLSLINKKKFLIRRPYDKHQFTFLLATNWMGFPEFKKIGMYDITSPEGKEIFNSIAFTQKERETYEIGFC